MKNRVLRSALAVILVIAMVLTMAACDNSTDDVVTTTTPAATAAPATETPVAPTEAPEVTTAPTVAPTTSATKDTVADDFGITLEAFDGTYGTKITNADGDKVQEWLDDELLDNEDESEDYSESAVYGYYILNVSKSNIMDEDYDISISLDDTVIYTGSSSKLHNGSSDLLDIDVSDFYDGDADAAYANIYFIDEDEIYIVMTTAGTYELELEVLITEAADNYGAWDLEDRDEWETEISSVLSIAKEELTVEVDAIVVMEDEDEELFIGEDGFTVYVGDSNSYDSDNGVYTDAVEYASFPTLAGYGDLDEDSSYELEYSLNYTKKAAVGTYEVVMTIIEKSSDDEMDIDDINDELTNQTIVDITAATIYVVSEYDWNEIRDVVTSIGEINYDVVDGFYGDDSNLATQAVLALARYNALSTEQQAYFDNGVVSPLETYITTQNVENYLGNLDKVALEAKLKAVYDAANSAYKASPSVAYVSLYVTKTDQDANASGNMAVIDYVLTNFDVITLSELASWDSEAGADADGKYAMTGATYNLINDGEFTKLAEKIIEDLTDDEGYVPDDEYEAANFLDFLEDAEEAIEEKYILDAFQDAFDDSDMEDYFDTSYAYSTSNSSAITAYNTVNSYWNSLSDDDQEVIEDNATVIGGDYDAYTYYEIAVDAFDAAEVDAVVELIAGAYAAYQKALVNGAKILYQDETDSKEWAYINSTEVKTLTAQAWTAYSALSSAQKELLDVPEYEYHGYTSYAGANDLQIVDLYEDDKGNVTTVAPTTTVDPAPFVVNISGKDYEIEELLDKLVAMNNMIDTMTAITNYVNIEDYSTEELLYARLNMLVYGDTTGMYFPATDTDSDYEATYRFAMADIMAAPDRNYDAIIAEYQAWIDYLLDLEDYKAGLADEFEAAVAEYFSGNEDYSDKVASYAVDNDEYDAIIDAIMGEGLVDILSTTLSSTYYSASSIDTAIKAEIGTVITASFLETWDIEDFETAYEAMVDAFDIEEIIDIYCEAFVTE